MSRLTRTLRRFLVRTIITRAARPAELPGGTTVIFAPHPDDEVLACGGLIAREKMKKTTVSIVFLSDGESSHQECCQAAPETVAAARIQTAYRAGEILGLRPEVFRLSLPDRRIPRADDPAFAAAVQKTIDLLDRLRPQTIYTPHPQDQWPDHEAATQVVLAALKKINFQGKLFYYPVWMWHKLTLSASLNLGKDTISRIDISTVSDKKNAAIKAYLSSLNPDCPRKNPFCGKLSSTFVRHFLGPCEIFFPTKRI